MPPPARKKASSSKSVAPPACRYQRWVPAVPKAGVLLAVSFMDWAMDGSVKVTAGMDRFASDSFIGCFCSLLAMSLVSIGGVVRRLVSWCVAIVNGSEADTCCRRLAGFKSGLTEMGSTL